MKLLYLSNYSGSTGGASTAAGPEQSNHSCKYWRLCPSSISLRAQFAVENHPINQLHGSASQEEANREISFFFPQQQTLAVIKPDAMREHKGPCMSFVEWLPPVCAVLSLFCLASLTETILEEIRGSGFSVVQSKETVLTKEMAEELYKEHKEKPYFSQVVEFMSRWVSESAAQPFLQDQPSS